MKWKNLRRSETAEYRRRRRRKEEVDTLMKRLASASSFV